ncbi:MAG: TRAP transporter small permease [Desulfobacterales bacterium]|nr:TRAP transporter small permease [Desulfobacterales bacterium]
MLDLFLRSATLLNRITGITAMVVLFLMMMLTTGDVAGRFLFNKPVQGSFELIEIMLATIVFCAMAYCQSSKGHIAVDIVVKKLSRDSQKRVLLLNYLLTLCILGLIAWKSFENAIMVMHSKDVTMILGIPLYPFMFLVVLGAAGMSLEVIRDIVNMRKRGDA